MQSRELQGWTLQQLATTIFLKKTAKCVYTLPFIIDSLILCDIILVGGGRMVRIIAAVGVVLIFAAITWMWRLWNRSSCVSFSEESQKDEEKKGNDLPPDGFKSGEWLRIRAHGGGTRLVRIIGSTSNGWLLVDYGGNFFRRNRETLERLRII